MRDFRLNVIEETSSISLNASELGIKSISVISDE